MTRDWRTHVRSIADIASTGAFLLVFVAYFCLAVPIFFLAPTSSSSPDVGLGQSIGVLAISIVGGMNVFGSYTVPLAVAGLVSIASAPTIEYPSRRRSTGEAATPPLRQSR